MKYVELYIRFLCCISIILLTGQTVFDLYFAGRKINFNSIVYILVSICYWYMITSFLFVISVWKKTKNNTNDFTNCHKTDHVTIDLLIPCYDEDLDLIKNTLLAVRNIKYPKELLNIYLLDDSKRDVLREMCREMNCATDCKFVTYITRPNNQFQKPGNLNSFFRSQKEQTLDASIVTVFESDEFEPLLHNVAKEVKNFKKGDYVCVLDCDMIPKPDIFEILIPYFYNYDENHNLCLDETIAFVQPRQYFYNCKSDTDYFDMDNSVYVKLILPAMNEINNTPYIGTNALISRKALESVNYFFEGHATEDTITSLILCSTLCPQSNMPYKSKYVYPQIVAEGFAPETVAEAFDQRLRWIKGNVQLVLNKNPLFISNFGIRQRISWFATNAHWIFGIFFLLQTISNFYILIEMTITSLKDSLNEIIIYQFSFLLQFIIFMLLPEVTFYEKIRSIQMFSCYVPVHIYALLSYCCKYFSISFVSNKNIQRRTHILFLFHIIILLGIYILCIYNLIVCQLTILEHIRLIGLIIIYTFLFFPVIRSLLSTLKK
jgi:cellulose synthase (UDP-forming)